MYDLLLNKAKMALRISCSDFDSEIESLITAGLADLGLAGILTDDKINDPLITRAVITYVQLHFSTSLEPAVADRLEKSYQLQRGQLYMSTGYTDWLNGEEEDTQDGQE